MCVSGIAMNGLRSVFATRSPLLLGLTFGLITTLAAQVQPGPVTVRRDIHHDVSPPLRDLIRKAPPPSLERRETEPVLRIPPPPGLVPLAEDLVRQRTTIPSTQTVGLSFEGLGQGQYGFTVTSIPPDTEGAVGATQYVQWVNTSFAIFSKSNGALLAGPTDGNTLWSGFGNGCETDNDGDPIAIYDKFANRWVMSQFAGVHTMGPYLQCIAVSTTSDATGTWNRYSFQYDDLDDYPKMGVWPDAYYETFNIFNTNDVFIGSEPCAYDRTAMLNGQSATEVCFPPNPYAFGLLPADVDGTTPPPAGSPNYMVSYGTNTLNLYQFHVDFNTPTNSTFTGPTVINVASFFPLCGKNDYTCVPQPQPGLVLDSLADRLMYRLAYRNFGSHESLVVNHSVAVSGSGGVRWYEIQSPGGTPVLAQQGTFAPDSNYRWMGSVAMDQAGDLAVGYSISSSSVYPSIAFAGRVPTDPPGTLEAEINVVGGTGAQTSPKHRWGDYSAMTVDPIDDCTFWYTQEYMQTDGDFSWNTRIVSFKFPGCGSLSSIPTQFVAVTPCRVVDTRTQYGGSGPIPAGNFETFDLLQLAQSGGCASLSPAAVYSLNITVVPLEPLGYLTIWPAGQIQPGVSTMNSPDGRVKANAAIVPAATNGAINVFASDTTNVVIDIDGYFAPAASGTDEFYPLPPCRVADTRKNTFPQGLGAPYLKAGVARDFPVLNATSCNIPSTAQAYSFNITAVPHQPLGFLTVWPAGQPQPNVSTLNAPTGTVVANAAIVPAGMGDGDIEVYASDDTDLVIDINGYFAAPGQNGLSLYPVTPCRVLDTRTQYGGNGAFIGEQTVNVVGSACAPPSSAQAYGFNATVVPLGSLGYLTLWPDDGSQRPVVSTLDAIDGAITSNRAIVPTNNGEINAYASDLTQLILDVSSYFAP